MTPSTISVTPHAGANLAGAKLVRVDLYGAYLSGADLSGADLSGADLTRADLDKANLAGANLAEANLEWADLDRANLAGANLAEANLSGADLSEADLSGAKYGDLKLAAIVVLTGLYRHQCWAAITTDGAPYVRMGCLWYSVDKWDSIGIRNSNPSEFPDDGSAESEERAAAFELVRAKALRMAEAHKKAVVS
jgi:uncharacterized protein YjbI with pentapeptide repeats